MPRATAVVEHHLAVLAHDRHVLEIIDILLGAPPEVPEGLVSVVEASVARHVEARPEFFRRLWPEPGPPGEPRGQLRECHPPPRHASAPEHAYPGTGLLRVTRYRTISPRTQARRRYPPRRPRPFVDSS